MKQTTKTKGTMTAEKFMKLSYEEIKEMFDRPIGICAYDKCKQEVRASEEHRTVPAGVNHTDCYYDAWGDEVEKHPIGAGRIGARGSNLDKSDLEVSAA